LSTDYGKIIPPLIYCHFCRKHVALHVAPIVPDRSAEAYNSWRRKKTPVLYASEGLRTGYCPYPEA
jgi:hypothetical protein